MIDVARRKLAERKLVNVRFGVQDAYYLSYADSIFDVVIASNVLHVMVSPERALASMARVMKRNAVLVAPVYCHGHGFLSCMVSHVMSLRGFKTRHRWSVPACRDFLEANGFRIIHFQVVPGVIPLALPALHKTKGE